MTDWIESKWKWYKALPWYWKIAAGVIGLLLLLLLLAAIIGGGIKLPSRDKSDKVHNDFVNEAIEEKIKKDEELKKEIEESKLKIEEIVKKENKTDEEAKEIEKKINEASSIDEVREILKGLSQ